MRLLQAGWMTGLTVVLGLLPIAAAQTSTSDEKLSGRLTSALQSEPQPAEAGALCLVQLEGHCDAKFEIVKRPYAGGGTLYNVDEPMTKAASGASNPKRPSTDDDLTRAHR